MKNNYNAWNDRDYSLGSINGVRMKTIILGSKQFF